MADDPKAGTPEATPDGAEKGGTLEMVEDGSEAGDDKVTISKGELGVWKGKAEKVNALEEENKRLKAAMEARPATDTRASEADERRKALRDEETYIAKLQLAADAGNEDAKVLVKVRRDALEAEQRTIYRLEMFEVPKEDRDEVQSFMREHGLTSPAHAHRLIRGGRFESLADENARLKKELEQSKKKPEVKGTRIVGESRAQATKSGETEHITPAEYRKRMRENPKQTINDRRAKKFVIDL